MDEGNIAPLNLTTTQRDAVPTNKLTPGLTIFNTTTAKLNFFDGTSWVAVTSA
jgi:hypothetical protein